MAEEVGSAASAGAKAALNSFMNPSIDIVKTIPQGIIELILRGTNVVLALISLIAAAACQNFLRAFITNDIVHNIRSAAGWVIFVSFWVMFYQIIAILQLFLRIKIVYTTVPIIKWSIFFLVDIIAIGIAAGGYLCGGIPLAVYAYRIENVYFIIDQDIDAADRVHSSAAAASAFSFFTMSLSIGMVAYFIIARYVLKWSTHGEPAPEGRASSTQGNYAADHEQ